MGGHVVGRTESRRESNRRDNKEVSRSENLPRAKNCVLTPTPVRAKELHTI